MNAALMGAALSGIGSAVRGANDGVRETGQGVQQTAASVEGVKDILSRAKNLQEAHAMFDAAHGRGQQNISDTQNSTPYDGGAYSDAVGVRADADAYKAEAMGQRGKLFDQAINAADRQAAFGNLAAINDQANRAQAANNILNNYTSARSANQNFLASLNNVGRSVGAY